MALFNRLRIIDPSSAKFGRDVELAKSQLDDRYSALGAWYAGYIATTGYPLCHQWLIDNPSDKQLGETLLLQQKHSLILSREYKGCNPIPYSLDCIVQEIGQTLSRVIIENFESPDAMTTARCWSGVRAMEEMIKTLV